MTLPLLTAALLLVSCSMLGPRKTVVSSDFFPGISIECVGEAVVPAYACRAWGEKLLAGTPDAAPSTVRLVLTYRSGNARCAADFFDAGGGLITTAAAVCPKL